MTDVLFDFKNPDYQAVYKKRAERLHTIRTTEGALAGLLEFYKTHPAEFINDWGMTFDPRNAERGLPTNFPFVLFPKQIELVNWVNARWKSRDDGVIEKSRDIGMTWLAAAIAHWITFFHAGTVVGFGSRKEDLVDKNGDPDSIFWKIQAYIAGLPIEFRPKNQTRTHLCIVNNDNGSVIKGEAGDNIGRGGRTSIYFKDESAHYERQEIVDAALSATSNCKIDMSSVNGNGNLFYRKRMGGEIPVFSFHWSDDPRKDKEWYEKKKRTVDPVLFAQEYDLDYNASTNDSWIPGDFVEEAMKLGPADVVPIGGWVIGIDAAHMGDDESVIHLRRGRLNLKQITRRKLDGIQLAGLVTELCGQLELQGVNGRIDAIIIELDGPGASCYDQLRDGRYKKIIYGVHTGQTLADGRNYNLRARMWRDAMDYLKNGGVSVYQDRDFKSQLCSVKYKYKDSLLLMQSKKEYKKEFGRSPDRADAFVLTFAVRDIRPVQDQFEKVARHNIRRQSDYQGY